MNFLAHLYLAQDSDAGRLGGILGDFVKGALPPSLPVLVAQEIRIHRRIDAFTDEHPVVRAAKAHFDPAHRRFAGIVLDVFFDHVLASRWEAYSDLPLEAFAARFYGSLDRHADLLPEAFARIRPSLVAHDWLTSYRDFGNVERALSRMSRRLRRGEGLVACAGDLAPAYGPLTEAFETFFPELQAYVREVRAVIRQD